MDSFFTYRSGVIHYTDRGQGHVVILVHGYLETAEIWGNFAERLAERFRIIAIDLPGHGSSSVFGDVHTMEFMAEAINDLIESLDINRVFLVGHSMGGYVALAFAGLFPEKLSGFCLFHSHPFADTPETVVKRNFETDMVIKGKKELFFPLTISRMYARDNLDKFSEAVHKSRTIASTIQEKGITAVLKGMTRRPSRLEVIESGRLPLLWILGAGDNFIDPEAMLSRVTLPPNAEAVILEQSGHMGFIEEEDLSVSAVACFADRLR